MGNPNTSEPADGCPLEGRLHASRIIFSNSQLFHGSPLPDTTSKLAGLMLKGQLFLHTKLWSKYQLHSFNNCQRFSLSKIINNHNYYRLSHRNGLNSGSSSERLAPKFLSSQICYTAASNFYSQFGKVLNSKTSRKYLEMRK